MKSESESPETANLPTIDSSRELDEHGFDPADYKWVPVLRRPRSDGWTPQRQVEFIAALADCGTVAEAAAAVGMSVTSCYRLRRSPGAENFAAAWEAAVSQAARKLVDVAFDRAIHGSDEPVFDAEGRRVGRRFRQNDRLLMFLLRAYMPERFRYAHRDLRRLDEPIEPPSRSLGEALRRLEPVTPAEPHLLMAPDDLEIELQCADMLGGELPRWHQGRPEIVPPEEFPLGEEFERRLEEAKRAAGPRARTLSNDDGDPPLA